MVCSVRRRRSGLVKKVRGGEENGKVGKERREEGKRKTRKGQTKDEERGKERREGGEDMEKKMEEERTAVVKWVEVR